MAGHRKARHERAQHPKWLWGVAAGLAIFAVAFIAAMSRLTPAPADPNATLRAANCDGDVVCAGSRARSAAELACTPLIESQVRYEVRWPGEKLPLGRWSERSAVLDQYGKERVIQYEGQGALFQNGFGAWRKLNYECDFDVVKRVALFVRVYE